MATETGRSGLGVTWKLLCRTPTVTLSEELAAANERLTARLSELERRLGLNSGNSSMPPSSDNFGRPEKKAAPRSRRKRDRQPGAGDNDRVRFPR
ncbi:DUF6444 domain-containing protein [Streptomyces sp. DvalAA-43]|uniref:DUF6444 domain-containing protein n=1 Tax=Streptomyces sp. DvalAA-43 TaxID=1839762 RepID=UPI0035201780